MKRPLALTLFALLAISCVRVDSSVAPSSKGSNMSYSVGSQAELEVANHRVDEYRQELLRQGFRQVSAFTVNKTDGTSITNSRKEFVLEGEYGSLKDLRVTLWTTTQVEKDEPQLGGGIQASIIDDQADRDFEALYKKVCLVVTGTEQ